MEDSFISVEELNICFGDNKVVREEKDFVKDEDEDDIPCETIRKMKSFPDDKQLERQEMNRAKSRANGQKIPSKTSRLPSLGQAENLEYSRAQQDAVWTLCTALNVPTKEHSSVPWISSSDPQSHLCAKGNECKSGRTILAPLDRKQHLTSKHGGEGLVLKPQTPPKGKQKKTDKESDYEVYFTPITKTPSFGQDEESCGKSYEEITNPTAKNLSPSHGLKKDRTGLDFYQNRRFSMPVSPRLLRRFNKEKLYSSPKEEESEKEDNHNYPERTSAFSPPSKDFDSIQDKKDDKFIISNTFIPLKANRENRKSLDLSLDTNSLRFLSEIKVSLGKESSSEPVFPKVKKRPEQRKNSYSLSASSETIFRQSLPEMVATTSLPHVQSSGRSRASTFTSLETVVPFESKMLGKTTLEAPMLLEVGSRRLSHLSLSPRLSRKR